jgi:GT2 family glycosyltransferase
MDVSVILPFRDAAATVAEAIEGVLAERDLDLEVIALDDRSRDEGPAIVAAIARRDPRVRLIAGEGAGLVAAVRRAIDHARAPLLARMDADDVSRPGRVARAVASLRAEPTLGAVGTQVEPFPAAAVGAGLLRYVAWQNAILSRDEHARALFVESPLCHPSVTIRRDAYDRVGGFRDGPFPEDYDLWLRLDAAGYGLAKVPAVLLGWRHHEGRVTFDDPRCALARFADAKAPFLAPRLLRLARPIVVWGAGKTGKRLARALEPHGVRPIAFVDIDPHKIGRPARGVPVIAPEALRPREVTILVAVGEPGARDVVRARLDAWGLLEGSDYVCGA